MTEQANTPANEVSFKDFLFKNKRNRTLLWLAAIAIVIQFAAFKYLYPFASYIHGDSFNYLNAADKNLSINTYLIGYSKFLRLFSVFAKSDFALVAFQYLFIQCGSLFLLFTIFYFYRIGRITQLVLLSFMVFNPLFLHLGNMISSDGFFLSLSLIWFSLLLWIIHRPSNRIIIWHAVTLFISFTVRYNAIIYPFIAWLAFWISNVPWQRKIVGMALSVFMCGLFIGYTMFQHKKLTGYWQYSPFSGWQLANNAMYAYRYVDSGDRKQVTKRFQALDNMIREYFDTSRNTLKNPQELLLASTVYMWTKKLTLFKYRDSLFRMDSSATELKKWASMGPLYKDYGIYIIKKYPLPYVRYFLWPNCLKYYAPPTEFLGEYNSGTDTVNKIAKTWFNYENSHITTRLSDSQVLVLEFYPILSGIINAVILCTLIFYVILSGWTFNNLFGRALLLGCSFWLINAVFTIFASSAALRFQAFPIILTTTYVALLLDWMIHLLQTTVNNNSTQIAESDSGKDIVLSNASA